MTTSVFNERRRRKRQAEKVIWKREQRHTGGDWKYREKRYDGPNAQANAEDQGKEKR